MPHLFDVDNLQAQRNEAYVARRFGRVAYTKQFLETAPEAVQKLYSKIIPVSVTYDFARELFEVTAMSPYFDSVEEAYEIPYYGVHVKVQKRKKGSEKAFYISFIKVSEE